MIERLKFILLSISIVCLSSCSRMVVNVSTADLEVVEVEAEKIRNRTEAYYYASVKTVFFSNNLFNEELLKKDFGKLVEKNIKEGLIDSDDKPRFQKIFNENIRNKIEEIKSGLYQWIDKNQK